MLRKMIFLAVVMSFVHVAAAATFVVSNPVEFQDALTIAQSNRENDVIDVRTCSGTGCSVVAGFDVYDITAPLTYAADSDEAFALTIDGFDSDTRILRGIGVPIITIDTTGASDDIGSIIVVNGLTLVEGVNSGSPNDGGALSIRVNSSHVEVRGSVFGGNAADGDGGALFIRAEGGAASPFIVIDDITFDTNSAGGDGGGAYVAASDLRGVILSNIDFRGNDAANGGGLHIEGLDPNDPNGERVGNVDIFDVFFTANTARTGDGGGANIAAIIFEVRVTGFVSNFAASGSGGGLYFQRNFSLFTMVNTGFVGNQAGVDGGGFATEPLRNTGVTVTNNTIYSNSAAGRGGGALISVGGTGIARIYNNIIYANGDAAAGQDIFIDNDPFLETPVPVQFFNNNITALAGFPDASSDFGITSSAELTSDNNIDDGPVLPNILDPDPDPSQGALSPTIDAGDNDAPLVPTVDFEGDLRPQDGNGDMVAVVDIGMDEFVGGALPQADLSVTKTDNPDPVTGGDNVTYSITVTNAGPDTATGVTLTDTIDATTTFVSAIFNQGNPCTTAGMPLVITCVLGDIESGNSVPGTVVVTSPSVDSVTGIANSVTVSGNETDPVSTNNTMQEGTTVVPASGPAMADLSITKTDRPDPVLSGGPNLTYTITIDNLGPDAATSVSLSDTLPTGVTFQSVIASTGQCDTVPDLNRILNCSLGDLAVTSNATVTIVVTPDIVMNPTTIINSATVTAVEEDPALTNNSVAEDTTVNPPSSDLSVSVSSSPDSPQINEQITYDITVSNTGPSNNTGTVLTVVLPPMTTFVSASVDQGSCDESGGTLTCTIGDLAAGATVSAQVVVMAPAVAVTLTLFANVAGDVADPTPANNASSEDVTVFNVIDVIIEGTSKGGSFGWIELLLLLAIAGIIGRRARRGRAPHGARTTLPALLCAISVLVLAPAEDVQAQDAWYVGISAGTTSLDYGAGALTSDLASLGWTINNAIVDDSNNTWKLYVGYQFNDWFALEAGYADLGEVVTQYGATIAPNEIDPLLDATLSIHPYQGDGLLAVGVLRYALSPDQFFVTGRAGLFAWESDTLVRVVRGGTGSVSSKDDGTDVTLSIGVEWRVNEWWSLTADWERYKLNEWLDVPSVGVKITF